MHIPFASAAIAACACVQDKKFQVKHVPLYRYEYTRAFRLERVSIRRSLSLTSRLIYPLDFKVILDPLTKV